MRLTYFNLYPKISKRKHWFWNVFETIPAKTMKSSCVSERRIQYSLLCLFSFKAVKSSLTRTGAFDPLRGVFGEGTRFQCIPCCRVLLVGLKAGASRPVFPPGNVFPSSRQWWGGPKQERRTLVQGQDTRLGGKSSPPVARRQEDSKKRDLL